MPSVVALRDEEVLVGDLARIYAQINPNAAIFWGNPLLSSSSDFQIGECLFSSEDFAYILLDAIKQDANNFLDENTTDIVLTMPNDCCLVQRHTLLRAAHRAGLNVLHLVPSGAAAAYHYAAENPHTKGLMITIDIGFGFNLTLIDIQQPASQNEPPCIEIRAGYGASNLGGHELVNRIIEFIIRQHKANSGIDLGVNPINKALIYQKCSTSQIDLTSTEYWHCAELIGDTFVELTLHRKTIEELMHDLVLRMSHLLIDNLLGRCGLEPSDINFVLPMGSLSYLPIIQQMVGEFFSNEQILQMIDPKFYASKGAAIIARYLLQEQMKVQIQKADGLPFSIGKLIVKPILFRSLGIPYLYREGKGSVLTLFQAGTSLPCNKNVELRSLIHHDQIFKLDIYEAKYTTEQNDVSEEWYAAVEVVFCTEFSIAFSREGAIFKFAVDLNGLLAVSAITCQSSMYYLGEIKLLPQTFIS